jgi:hypothetical protein
MSEIIDFYSFVNGGKKQKMDKSFKNHGVEPASHILCIGGTGSGKSTALLNFIHLKPHFFRILIYAPSTDPLYELLKERIPDVEIYNDINEFPDLTEIDADELEKLVVFDDFINLKSKEMRKINNFLIAGRKKHISVFLMAQNYTSVPKLITRNINYFIIFKLNDNVSIRNIVKNHNISEMSLDEIKKIYHHCTEKPKNFFMIDLKTGDGLKKFRHNFTGYI